MSFIGLSARRIDAVEKVTGAAVYTPDIKLPGMAFAALLHSPIGHARILRLDTRKAREMPGVYGVLTGSDLKPFEDRARPANRDSYCMAIDRVRFEGEVVAAVAARTPEEAQAALRMIDVDYEPLPVVATIDEAEDETLPRVHADTPNVIWTWEYQHGNVSEAFKEAHLIVEDTFDYPVNHHFAMEPHGCVVDAGEHAVVIWSSTRNMFGVQREVARMFGYPLAAVDVRVPFVGGAYGSKSYARLEPIAVALSRLIGRPVKLVLSIDESFRVSAGHAVRVKMKSGVTQDGRLLARDIVVWVDTGAYADLGPLGFDVAQHFAYRAPGPYQIPNLSIRAARVYTNKVPGSALRGYGAQNVAWAYESHMDQIAAKLGMDPVELRRRNLLAKGEPPYPGRLPIDGDYRAALETAVRAIEWEEQPPLGSGRGKGIAVALKNSGGVRTYANAIVRLHADATVTVMASFVESGQGAQTVMAQIVANVLGHPLDKIRLVTAQTQLTPFDQITGSSGTTVVTGRAVQRAAEDLRDKICQLGSEVLGVPADQLKVSQATVLAPDGRSMPLDELMRKAFGPSGGELMGVGSFRRTIKPGEDRTLFYEFGVGAAEVEVDLDTGAIKLLRYVAVSDVGKAINRQQAEGQDQGGAVMGMGQALWEELVYEDGQLLNGSLIDYRVPRASDLPQEFESILIENEDGPGPFGSKGAGEGGLLPVAPAIANAVFRATGARIHQLPLTPERVWQALQQRAMESRG